MEENEQFEPQLLTPQLEYKKPLEMFEDGTFVKCIAPMVRFTK